MAIGLLPWVDLEECPKCGLEVNLAHYPGKRDSSFQSECDDADCPFIQSHGSMPNTQVELSFPENDDADESDDADED